MGASVRACATLESNPMGLYIHERHVRRQRCADCREHFDHVTGYVNGPDGPFAVYFAACHGHPDHEAQIDVILGTWGTEEPVDDHVVFSCRLRPNGAMAVDAMVAVASDAPLSGQRLTRERALNHARSADFWSVVDLLAIADPSVTSRVYGTRSES